MGTLAAFVVGYVVGIRGGRKRFDEVVESIKTLRDSEEVAAILRALGAHAAYLLREVSELGGNRDLSSEEMIAKLQALARNVDPRSSAS
jgi:hypothetical protein